MRMETIASLTARFPRPGRLDWIGLRPDRRAPMNIVEMPEDDAKRRKSAPPGTAAFVNQRFQLIV